MKLYKEYRDSVVRVGKPVLSDSPISSNFMSYFKYPEETYNYIINQGHMKDLKQMEVYCDEIYIDVDDPSQFDLVDNVIRNHGFNYTKYSTGGRSHHWHIRIQPILSIHTPYSIKEFFKRLGIYEAVDTSMLHPAGQFRQEGAVHRKTGKKKTLIHSQEGLVPSIPVVEEPEVEIDTEVSYDDHKAFMYGVLLLSNVGEGSRYKRLYAITRHGLDAGEDPNDILYDLQLWNKNLDVPHREYDIEKWHKMIINQERRR